MARLVARQGSSFTSRSRQTTVATAAAQRRHAGLAERWASRVLGALGGAVAITGAAWAISAASAAADKSAETPATSVAQTAHSAFVPSSEAPERASVRAASETLLQPVFTSSEVQGDRTRTADEGRVEQPAPSESAEQDDSDEGGHTASPIDEHASGIADTITDVGEQPILRPVHDAAEAVDETVQAREQLAKLGTAIETLLPPDPPIHPGEDDLVELPALPQPPDSSAPPDDAVEQPDAPSPGADAGQASAPDSAVATPDAITDDEWLADSALAIDGGGNQAVSPVDVSSPFVSDTDSPDSAAPSLPVQLPVAPLSTPSTAPSCCPSMGGHLDGHAWAMLVGSLTVADSGATGAVLPAKRTLPVALATQPAHTPD